VRKKLPAVPVLTGTAANHAAVDPVGSALQQDSVLIPDQSSTSADHITPGYRGIAILPWAVVAGT